jgi:hypothetical protein
LDVPERPSSIKGKRTPRVNAAVKELISSPEALPVEEDDIKTAIHQISGLQQHHAENGDYPEAQHLQRILNSLNKKLKLVANKRRGVGDAKDVVFKKKELEAIVDRIICEWNESYEEFLTVSEQECDMIQARHQEELERFDAGIPSDLPNRYRAPSSRLQELRGKEQALAKGGQFVAAQRVRDQAYQVATEEYERKIGQKWQDDKNRRKQIVIKQRKEMKAFLEHMEVTRKQMIQERDKVLEGYLIRMEKVDRDLYRLRNEVRDYPLAARRERMVTRGEFSYPIPRMRLAAAFRAARQGARGDGQTSASSRASSVKAMRVARMAPE